MTQMALAVLLAAGAGLLIRSVVNLRAIDPGVDVDGVVVVDTTMPGRLTMEQRRLAVDMVVTGLGRFPAFSQLPPRRSCRFASAATTGTSRSAGAALERDHGDALRDPRLLHGHGNDRAGRP